MAALLCECYLYIGMCRPIVVQMERSTNLLHMLLRNRYGELPIDLYSDIGLAYMLGMSLERLCQDVSFPWSI